MKRRYANIIGADYTQKRIDEEYFKGYVCNLKFKDISNPLIIKNDIREFCIKDNDYEWFEVYPDNANYAITIMFDDKLNLIEWYFDIAKEVGIENNIPYEDDLYLDMIIMPNGQKLVLDEEELINALNKGKILQSDVDLAYQTLKQLEAQYVNNFDYLVKLTNKFCEIFESKTRVK